MTNGNNISEAAKIRRGRLTIAVIVLLFSAPLLLSWWLLNYTGISETEGPAKHGELIDPPRPIEDMALFNPVSGESSARLHGKWSLVYLIDHGPCTDDCEGVLYKMRQLRLAMGEQTPRVQRVLINFGPDMELLPPAMHENYRGQLTVNATDLNRPDLLNQFRLTGADDPLAKGRLYLIDPLGNLMMAYPAATEPKGIIKDLKRLLRYSRIG